MSPRSKLVHDIHTRCRVASETHDEDGARLAVHAPAGSIAEIQAELAAS